MKKYAPLFLFLLLSIQVGLFAQEKPDGKKALEHVRILADDTMEGRRSGTPGYQKAAEYVAEKMAEYGLKPAAKQKSYFQQVVFKNWQNFEQPIRLEIIKPEHRRYYAGYSRDYMPVRGTGSGKVRAQPVFAGYGIHADSLGWNDYTDLDVKGKIVMMLPSVPDSLGDDAKKVFTMNQKVKTAVEQGASGVMWMDVVPMRRRWSRRPPIEKETCPDGFVVMSVKKSIIDDLFYLCNQSWRDLVSRTIREQKSYTTSLDATIEMEAHFTLIDSLTAPNVIGVIPGRDRKLKKEVIILGGHLDHLGVGVDGFVYNGADDDAGSAGVLLEMARVFQANKFRPARTVVFASWAGEELGLVGSRYYTNNPLYPLDKTVVYMNMDMVATGDSDLYVGGMWEFSDFYDIVREALDDETEAKLRYRLNYRGSDHSAFLRKGVTAISLRTGGTLTRDLDDEHPEYHYPGDITSTCDPERLEESAQYHIDMIEYLANVKKDLMDPVHHIQFVHKDATVVDLHCDTIGRLLDGEDLSKDTKRGHIDIPKLKQGAVDLQVFACFVGPPGDQVAKNQAAEKVFRQIDGVHRLAEENPDDVAVVLSYQDYRRLRGTGKTGMVIGIEGGYAIESDLALLRSFYRTGVRLMTLTHWTRTEWADASGDPTAEFGGLTEFGEQVVKEMNKLGMIIDLSHAHDETYWDVLKITDAPVVASHSCCRALSEHHRNLDDEMLKALAENGGMIGINFAPGFLDIEFDHAMEKLRFELAKKRGLPTDYAELMKIEPERLEAAYREYAMEAAKLRKKLKPVDVKLVVDHIDHVVKVTGNCDHVGLGSDFDGISATPEGLEHVGLLSNITKELMAREYKEEDIKKILGGNFIRIFQKVCNN